MCLRVFFFSFFSFPTFDAAKGRTIIQDIVVVHLYYCYCTRFRLIEKRRKKIIIIDRGEATDFFFRNLFFFFFIYFPSERPALWKRRERTSACVRADAGESGETVDRGGGGGSCPTARCGGAADPSQKRRRRCGRAVKGRRWCTRERKRGRVIRVIYARRRYTPARVKYVRMVKKKRKTILN